MNFVKCDEHASAARRALLTTRQEAQSARPAEQITYKSSILDVVVVHLLLFLTRYTYYIFSRASCLYALQLFIIIYYSGDLFVCHTQRVFAIVCECRIEFNVKPPCHGETNCSIHTATVKMSNSLTSDWFLECQALKKEGMKLGKRYILNI